MATLPLKDDRDNLWINVKIRNVPVDVLLAPQSSDIQIDPELQRKWDLQGGTETEVIGYLGKERYRKLTGGKDCIELAGTIREHGLLVILIGDKNHPELTPSARSGLGQSLLNRFVYCVDAKRKEFRILSRVRAGGDDEGDGEGLRREATVIGEATAPSPCPLPMSTWGRGVCLLWHSAGGDQMPARAWAAVPEGQ